MSERHAVVTGGTGFTGRRLIASLEAAGWHVTLLTQSTSHLDELAVACNRIRIVRVGSRGAAEDVAAAVDEALDSALAPVVFSLATLRTTITSADVARMVDANVRLPTLLATTLARRGGGRMITTASYMLERHGIAPSVYSASRGSIDPILAWARAHAGVHVTTLAPTSIYGPGDRRSKILAALVSAAIEGTPLPLVHPDRLLDLVHVDDVARAYAMAAELPDAENEGVERYDVSSGTIVTLRQLVEVVEQSCGLSIDARWGERPQGPSDHIAPPESPRWVPGWEPITDLRTSLRSVIDHELESIQR